MKPALLLLALFCSACGASSPTAATPFVPTTPIPVPPRITLSGTLTATNGGQRLPGVTVTLGGIAAVTDAGGAFTAAIPLPSIYSITLSGVTIVPRTVSALVNASRTIQVDAFSLTAGFDLGFYRQLVRNAYDGPNVAQPLRRWTRTPSIYLKTVDEVGEVIHGPTLDLIETTAKDAVPRWTSGVLGVPIIERGTGTREGVSGWITIKFPATNTALAGYCGRAQVAVDGGWIELGYHSPPSSAGNCRTTTAVVAPHVVRHELGHALGFYHTGTVGDLMYPSSWFSPTGLPTAREVAYAALAYVRPVGNTDPDTDPSGAVTLTPLVVR